MAWSTGTVPPSLRAEAQPQGGQENSPGLGPQLLEGGHLLGSPLVHGPLPAPAAKGHWLAKRVWPSTLHAGQGCSPQFLTKPPRCIHPPQGGGSSPSPKPRGGRALKSLPPRVPSTHLTARDAVSSPQHKAALPGVTPGGRPTTLPRLPGTSRGPSRSWEAPNHPAPQDLGGDMLERAAQTPCSPCKELKGFGAVCYRGAHRTGRARNLARWAGGDSKGPLPAGPPRPALPPTPQDDPQKGERGGGPTCPRPADPPPSHLRGRGPWASALPPRPHPSVSEVVPPSPAGTC